MRFRRAVPAALVLVLAAWLGGGPAQGTPASRHPVGGARTFLSLWPACGCAGNTELDRFSLRDGRRLGAIAAIDTATFGPVPTISLPAASARGPVLVTVATGPRCVGIPPAPGQPLPLLCDAIPRSCRGRVEAIDRATGAVSTLLAVPGAEQVDSAVPSPAGDRIVTLQSDCLAPQRPEFAVRDLRTGRSWTLGADAPICDGLGQPAWSPAGTRLVFAYAPAAPHARVFGFGCPATEPARLAVVAAGHASAAASWRLIRADPRCAFQAAAFDRWGIAAVEACAARHSFGGPTDTSSGPARLLQLAPSGRVRARVRLRIGWLDGAVSRLRDGQVLVSEDQPSNSGYRPHDWVWVYDGRRLRLVGRYRTEDAAQVIAVSG